MRIWSPSKPPFGVMVRVHNRSLLFPVNLHPELVGQVECQHVSMPISPLMASEDRFIGNLPSGRNREIDECPMLDIGIVADPCDGHAANVGAALTRWDGYRSDPADSHHDINDDDDP